MKLREKLKLIEQFLKRFLTLIKDKEVFEFSLKMAEVNRDKRIQNKKYDYQTTELIKNNIEDLELHMECCDDYAKSIAAEVALRVMKLTQ